MDIMMGQIVVLGGGGFSRDENPAIDRYILKLTGKPRPKICFLPQASAESQQYVAQFYSAFTALDTRPSWFSLFGEVADGWEERLLDNDVIYVGGGNTRSMLALWREWGVDKILKQAYENGTILAGISAGMLCWFEQGVTDSVKPLGIIPCLGFIEGSGCPHYDSEPMRQPTYTRMVADGTAQAGIAIYDSAAAHYIDGKLHQVVTSKPTAKAFRLYPKDGQAISEELPTTYLGVDSY